MCHHKLDVNPGSENISYCLFFCIFFLFWRLNCHFGFGIWLPSLVNNWLFLAAVREKSVWKTFQFFFIKDEYQFSLYYIFWNNTKHRLTFKEKEKTLYLFGGINKYSIFSQACFQSVQGTSRAAACCSKLQLYLLWHLFHQRTIRTVSGETHCNRPPRHSDPQRQ